MGEGWKIALLLNSSKFCRALFAFSTYPVPWGGPAPGEALVTSAASKEKKWETAGKRQNHSADVPPHPGVLGSTQGGSGPVQLRRYGGRSGIRCKRAVEYAGMGQLQPR